MPNMSGAPYRLVGRTVTSFAISADRREIVFQTTEGPVEMYTDGDCCSVSWVESLDNPDALVGTVSSVEDIEMPNLGNIPTKFQEYVEEVRYYGLKIETDKGTCVLDYRNNSNGYYGGSIEDIPRSYSGEA